MVIIILKSLEEDICFEPLIITANKNEIDDILPEKLEEHYEKVKNDINDVEKFLGKKTMIQTKIIQEKVKDTHVSSNDFDIDLDF
ncbi:MAG: hypothetical protein JXR64_02890 [Spirochaetales bacterium]|nr:hypothetical protein [Spirochaetales bacterium]